MTEYMIKAVREGQTHSSWVNPDVAYESALIAFVSAALDTSSSNAFLEDFRRFIPPITRIGAFSSLSQQLLKLTAPGVPDIYQGTELWNLSLVDPDNRRPVDYALRAAIIDEFLSDAPSAELAEALLANLPSGKIKLFLTARALAHRSVHADLYARGNYEPLETSGPLADHLVAFRRALGDDDAIVVVPRLVGQVIGGADGAPVGEVWRETVVLLDATCRGRRYRNEFTGAVLEPTGNAGPTLAVNDVLQHFPVALLSGSTQRTTTRNHRTG